VDHALTTMRQVLAASRAAGLPVIHVRTAGRYPDGKDLSRKTRSQGIRTGRGSREAELMPDVTPLPDEIVLDKPGSGAFTGTGLDEVLRNLGIEHVILCGISYDAGVESSLRSATDRGYGLVFVPDACACVDEAEQEGLWHMESGTIQVRSAADVANRIAAL
jgi:nicotinamidase-related amidase